MFIQNLKLHDLPAVSQIHLAAFPNSALSKLGPEAIRRYYEWQLTGPHDVTALGSFLDDKLVGFCFGGIFRGAMSGYLYKNSIYWIFLIIALAILIIMKKQKGIRIFLAAGLAFIILIINAFILKFMKVSYIIDYEQAEFANRVLQLSFSILFQ